jgi:hypothetical protein
MHFVVSERRRVRKRLAHVFLFQIGQLLDDLCRRQAVGNQIHHVRYRDAQAADRGSAGKDRRVLRDAVKCIRHKCSVT